MTALGGWAWGAQRLLLAGGLNQSNARSHLNQDDGRDSRMYFVCVYYPFLIHTTQNGL